MAESTKKECVSCAELIQLNAKKCRFCGESQVEQEAGHDEKPERVHSSAQAKKFYQNWVFWVIAVLSILAALNGQNLAQYVSGQVSGELTLDNAKVEKIIHDGVKKQTGLDVKAECPSRLAGKVGDVRQCTVTDDFGTVTFVDITIQSSSGDITWQVRN